MAFELFLLTHRNTPTGWAGHWSFADAQEWPNSLTEAFSVIAHELHQPVATGGK